MELEFSYNFKGIIPVPARALKAKKIIISSFFLLLALLIYDIFTYAALLIDGVGFGEIFARFGFFPFDSFNFTGWLPDFIYGYLGRGLVLFALMLGIMANAAVDIEQLRGNPFFSYGQAIKFGFRRAIQLFLSVLALVIFIVAIAVLGLIIGLIARIPVVGEIIYGLFFFFPNFVVSIFTVLIIFITMLSVLIMPAATAADRDGEAFNSILETFLTITRRPFRWFGYTLYSAVTAKLCSFIFAAFALGAIEFLRYTTSLGGGEKIDNIIASGAALLPINSGLVHFTAVLFPMVNLSLDMQGLAFAEPSAGVTPLGGYLTAIGLFLIFLIIWGYFFSVISTGQAYAYAVIRKMRDDHAISEEKPLFFEDEWVNPPLDEDSTEGDEKTW